MIIRVKVLPNAKKSEIMKIDENNFRIRVNAPAEDGKANSRLLKILSKYFDTPESSISVLKGFKSRNKLVEIRNL